MGKYRNMVIKANTPVPKTLLEKKTYCLFIKAQDIFNV